jgi:uncharacterized protein YqeY
MPLLDVIEADLQQARRDRDEIALTALGLLKSEIVNASKEPGAGPIDDALVIRTARKELKKRQEAAELYRTGGREETARKELAEAEVIGRYLPAALSDDDLEREVRAIVAELGATPAEFGRVMKEATSRLGDRAEGGRIAALARRILAE